MRKKSQSTQKVVLHLNWFVAALGVSLLSAQPVAADCVSAVSGLLGWWTGDGNANNIFGTNNGILQGGATANATGLVGSAFNFDGTNSSVQIPDSVFLHPTNLTIEAWVRFASLDSAGSGGSPAGDQYIVFHQNTRTSDFEGFDLSKTRVGSTDVFRFLFSSASGQTVEIHSSTIISTGAWYHVAAIRGSNFVQLYVNGALERQTNITFSQDYGNFPLYFGTSGQTYWDHKLKGNLDEVSLYDRALASNDIAAIFLAGSAGKCKAPAITLQPQGQTVPAGTDVTFTVGATGFGPLNYQWRSNNSALAGATNPSLTLSNVQPADSADYTIVVTNVLGSTTSAVATLTVQAIPAQITVQPTNQVALFGSAATFAAAATGSLPLDFHWQKNGADLADGGRFNGVTTPSLTISNIQISDIGNYRLIASNAYGADISATANLSVIPIVIWGAFGATGPPATLTNAIAISAQGYQGERVNLGLKSDGTLGGWGNYYDGFGNHILTQADIPPTATNVVAISAGFRHGLALRGDGSLVAFGDNDFGETNIPPGLGPLIGIGGGGLYSLVLKSDQTPAGWGYQVVPPNGLSNLVAVSAGVFHSLAIKNDGTVIGWGYNGEGQTNPPAGLTNVIAVSAGGHHSMALKSDGTVVAWGYNYYGESTVPPDLSNVVAIAGGFYHSLALKNDGTVVAWGNNDAGQSSPPAGLSNVVGIAAANSHSVALLASPATAVAPVISWQGPTNRILFPGQSTLLLPSVTGSLPMSFQWYLNGAPLDGQTGPWLSLASPQPNQSGNYTVVASNLAGSVTSSVVLVQIGSPPSITQQAASQTNIAGGTAQFSVTVSGDQPLTYHWYQNSTMLSDDGRHSGTTTPNLTISNLAIGDGGNYMFSATSPFGSVSSALATLTVIAPPTITTQPRGYSVPIGLPITLSAAATGTPPLGYQWLLTGVPVPNATNPTLTISNLAASDFGNYQFVATNFAGAATSSIAPLTIGTVATWGFAFGGASSSNPMWPPPGLSNVIAIAGNNEYSLALKLDGTITGWARILGAPTNIPPGLSGIVSIAAGLSHALALRSNGTVVAWGTSGTPTNVPSNLSNVVAIAAGSAHCVVLRADGTVVAWGNGGIPTTNVPPGLIGVANIDCGANQTLALRGNGTVTVWGIATDQSPFPFGLPRLVNIAAISAGAVHNMVARNDGTIAVWGGQSITNIPPGLNNIIGVEAIGGGRIKAVSLALRSNGRVTAFGDNTTGMTNVPSGLSNVVALSGGYYHALALINDGRPLLLHPPVGGTFYSGNDVVLKAKVLGNPQLTFTWLKNGSVIPGATSESLVIPSAQSSDSGNYQSVAGNGFGVAQSVPVPVTIIDSGPILMSQPATRYAYQGSPWSVGASVIGSGPMQFTWSQNGGTIATSTNELVFDAGLPAHTGTYQLVASNPFGSVTSSVAQITYSRVAIWGTGVSLSNAPIDLGTVRDVVSAYYHVLAIKSDGTVAAWGTALNGATNVPAGLSNVVAVAGGKYFSVALRSDGRVVAWGMNNYGQTNIPSAATNLVAIAAGGDHVLALRADGRVIAWGNNANGQTTVPAFTDFVAIAGGQFHSAALRTDGTAVTWGSGASNPFNATNLVTLSSGFSQTFGLRRDGTVMTWMQGNEPVPPYLSNVVALASGGSTAQNYGHDFALIADGTPIGWGNDFAGQLDFPAELTSIVKITCGAAQTVALLNDRSPVVTVQPWDRRVNSGTNIAFTAFVVGRPPLTYQWRFNGATIPGATNPTLSLTAVNRGSNGLYSAAIFNNLSHADSRSAKLDIGGPLRLGNPGISPDGLFTLTAQDPLAVLTPSDLPFFGVLASTNLTDWETLQANLVLTNGTLLLQDPSPTNFPMRFYRFVEH
jgi:alpha-tubulin suppressor-like RCC1 family protein